MEEKAPRPERRGQIVSSTRGRIRLRVPRDRYTSGALTALAEDVRSLSEPVEVEVRPQSASMVIGFAPQLTAAVQTELAALGVSQGDTGSPLRDPAVTIAETATRFNRAVSARVPGGDLRLLLPLALGLLSARQFVRGDDRLSEAPWYLLAMYAAESFSRFHRRTS